LGEQIGFERRDAADAPGGVGEFLGEVGLGGSGGLVFVEELAAVELVGGRVFGGKEGGTAGEAVCQSVERRTLFAGGGAGPGGAVGGWWLVAGGWWGGDWICHIGTSDAVLAWVDDVFVRRAADVVVWEGEIDERVA
jgi:hypothetical protein